MNCGYEDILERIDTPPLWWDEHAVPRFVPFEPGKQANIYADLVVLLLIQCQGCGFFFNVCMSQSDMQRINLANIQDPYAPLSELVKSGAIHYGDPPNYCCGAGATMNSIPVRAQEFWRRGSWAENRMEWERVPELEIDLWPDWMPEKEKR